MSYAEDPRLKDAKDKGVREVLSLLKIYNLTATPNQREMFGPCPACGEVGRNPKSGPPDRFNINLATGAYFCRRCDMRGGDVIALVRDVEGCSFSEALTILCGDVAKNETPEQRKERERRQQEARLRAEARRKEDDAYAAKARARARKDAQRIWKAAKPGWDSPVLRAYLEGRGLAFALSPFPQVLRFLPDHPYVKKVGSQLETLHRGPCMIAVIQKPNGAGGAVHQTWIDPARPGKKAVVLLDGEAQPAKMVRGSKKGNAIRLITPEGADTLVMGEGIETTLSACAAGACPGAAYWTGVDLGNMAGKMKRVEGVKWSGQPDMGDEEAFVPPPWVKRLIFIQDGDSHPKATRAKLEAGLKRAMALRPGLKAQIVQAGDGVDLNDVLIGANGKNNNDNDEGQDDR
ncbi:DUF7146 domain-containing protein [Shimia aestuarii]|uniref:DUF7146 domain-containing protein n=1 Tax=Shimia aestuarii TaxID=254406 RepID=UPI001FB53A64|nr:hypothetical protein [Shimia aestuarii]